MEAASTALDVGEYLTTSLQTAITAPMADELDRLNLDIANTTRALIATLP
jgi:hypothetical protein